MSPRVYSMRGRRAAPPDAVYVGRPSQWGNPFELGPKMGRAEAIVRFRLEVLPFLDLAPLRGKDLVCWCAPKPCHADVLLEAANRPASAASSARPSDDSPASASSASPTSTMSSGAAAVETATAGPDLPSGS